MSAETIGEQYPEYADVICTCRGDCPFNCKGECGCKYCDYMYQDNLSARDE